MKKRGSAFLLGLAGALVLAAGAGTAHAYFTTYAQAQGGITIRLGSKTEIQEECSDWTKSVSITSDADSQPVYVRAKAFCGSEYSLSYTSESGKWEAKEDGYYYYSDIVYGGGSTDVLEISIGNVPQDVSDGDNFNVVVIYETAPVRYDDNGNPYADWTAVLERRAD